MAKYSAALLCFLLVLVSVKASILRFGGEEETGCPDNMEMSECATECDELTTCLNPSPKCSTACNPNVCVCIKGFVKDLLNGKCIRLLECNTILGSIG